MPPVVDYNPACPRCRTRDRSYLRRGALHSHSTFLPLIRRGRVPARRVILYCLHCGYSWRSVRRDVRRLPEISEQERTLIVRGGESIE